MESLQIESVGNGSITYKVGDKTVDKADIEYATEQEAMLHDVMSKSRTLNVRAANFMAQHIDPQNPKYINEAIDSYQAGWYGYDENKLDSFRMPLNHSHELYAYGKKAREEYDAKQKQAQNEARATRGSTLGEPSTFSTKKAEVYFVKDGKTVRFDGKNTGVRDQKRTAAVRTAEFLSRMGIGGKYYFYESYVNGDGKRVYRNEAGNEVKAPNGFYKRSDGSIYIDLNAGEAGDGITLFTLPHELTHFIRQWSEAKFNVLADFLIEEYGKTDKDMDARVKEKQDILAAVRGEDVSYDEAFEEVVADSMATMFTDGNLYEKLAKLKAKDNELFNKIKSFIDKILAKFRKVYAELTPDQKNAQDVRNMKEAFDRIQTTFAEALVEASENFEVAHGFGNGVTEDHKASRTETEKANNKYSIRMQFYKEFDAWDGKNSNVSFVIGTTSDALKSIGMKDQEIKMHSGMMISKINTHPEITRDIFRQVPTLLEHPIIVQFSDAIDPATQKPKYDDSITILGELYAKINENGKVVEKPVLVAVNLVPTKKKSSVILDFAVVKSAYTKDALQQYLNENSILYIDSDKKRTDSWLSRTRLSLPVGEKRYGPIRRIAYVDGKVKVQNPKNMTAMQRKLYEAGLIDEFGNKLFSERTGVSVSNRYLLVNALESAAQTDEERQMLQQYREKVETYEKAQKRLDTLNASLFRYSTAKNKDYEKIADFKKLAEGQAETVERIEARLTKMETSETLQAVIQRERAAVEEKLSELQYQYGNLPEGENAVRPDNLPKSTDGKNRVSLTARTVKGAAVTPDEFSDLIDREVTKGGLTYLPVSNDEATQQAMEYIMENGWVASVARWSERVRKGEAGAEMSAIGALLLNHAANAGDKAAWLEILADYRLMGTRAGQAVQALRILKKLAPADNLYMLQKSVEKMANDLGLGDQVEIDPVLIDQYNKAETDVQRDNVLGRIQADVAKQLPTSMMEMWTALRYTNMLGNFKTQIRNVFGNTAMTATNAIKNTVAASLELLANKVTGGKFSRTKSVTVSRELMKACRQDFAEVEALALDGGKYADAATSRFAKGIQENRTIFKAPEFVKNEKTRRAIDLALKPMEAYRRATSTAMEKGDLLFSKNAYARALAGYLKARGVRNTDLTTVDAALLDEARAYAIKEAQEVTFRDHNALTELLAQRRPGKTKVSKLARAAAQGIMPFRQTPANVLLRAEEYSPLGLINSIVLAVQYAQKKGVTGSQLINSFAKTFTGYGLFALGMILSNLGMAVGGPDDDEGKEAFDKLNGAQSYALKFGDTTWTFDWISPVSIPLFMGVNMWEAIQENGLSLDTIYGSLSSITEPMLQMSMLSGLSDTLEDVRYSENGLVDIALGALFNYATQVMTNSLLAQLERSWEDIRYTTYTSKSKELPTKWQYELGQASAKVPGVDYSQVPYINAWGEEEESLPFPSRLAYNLLSPSYHSTEKMDTVAKELYRLDEAQDENVFPSTPSKKYEERYLPAEEYVKLAKTQGTMQRELVEDLISSAGYANLSDAAKASAIRAAYKYAKEYAQIQVLGRKEFSAKWLNAINGNISEAILDHVSTTN